jgi:hypothetical protein
MIKQRIGYFWSVQVAVVCGFVNGCGSWLVCWQFGESPVMIGLGSSGDHGDVFGLE